jgi:hypothetical protein
MTKIGVTEIADAGLHFRLIKELYPVNILITKHLEDPELAETF